MKPGLVGSLGDGLRKSYWHSQSDPAPPLGPQTLTPEPLWWLISCEAMFPVGPIAKSMWLVLIAWSQLGVLRLLGGSYSGNIPWGFSLVS